MTACGSSGGSGTDPVVDVVAQASTGFAVAGETDINGVTFTKQNSFGVVGDGVNDNVIVSDELVIAPSDDGSALEFTYQGVTYVLVTAGTEDGVTTYVDAADVANPDDAGLIVAISDLSADDNDIQSNSGYVNGFIVFAPDLFESDSGSGLLLQDVFGFDTNPDTIAATTGSVAYAGQFSLFGVPTDSGGAGFDSEVGDLILTAEFDTQSISGSGTMSNNVGGTETLTFETAVIDGNSFSANVTSDDEFFIEGQTFSDVTYNGTFYGPGAEAVGGQISGNLDVAGEDPVLMNGVFVADEQ